MHRLSVLSNALSFLLILLYIQTASLFGQIIPPSRQVNWERAGLEHMDTENWKLVRMDTISIEESEIPTADDLMKAAVESLDGRAGIIYFPAGRYTFKRPVILRDSLLIQGESAASTQLVFDLGGQGHAIEARGGVQRDTAHLTHSASTGDSVLRLDRPELFQVGDLLILNQSDAHLVSSSWAIGSVGQIVKIESIRGDRIFLQDKLRKSYDLDEQPFLRKIIPLRHVGVSCLSIERLDNTSSQTSNIFFSYVEQGLIKHVESSYTNFAHIELDHSTHITVKDNYFHHAHDYGNGGKAYGVMLHFTTGDCLIEQNIFERLRHSMILQAGANGNVLGYNYSRNPFWTDVILPSDAAGDMVLHGNYPYANLFEGNVVQNLVVDASHGINGPLNTFFRNRIEHYGVVAAPDPPTDHLNLVGNEVTNREAIKGFFLLSGINHLTYANRVKGTVLPAGTDSLPEKTLYLGANSMAEFTVSLPTIGIPIVENSLTIPAEDRYKNGNYVDCEGHQRNHDTSTSISENSIRNSALKVYPNPFEHTIQVSLEKDQIKELSLYDIHGKKVPFHTSLNVANLPKGIYVLEVLSTRKELYRTKILRR